MQTVHSIAALQAVVDGWRAIGLRVAFVPTMGNLHAGHHALVRAARGHADRVLASVFVNPTQFGPNEDYSRYPRTLAADAEGLAAAGCDLLFAPPVEEMYPDGIGTAVRIDVPGLSEQLCGAFRPGHFAGVATVVAKLLNIAGCDTALFGEKDWQQLLVVRRLVRELAMRVEIVGVPTVREADGLAMSSRNQYLAPDERARAPELYAALNAVAAAVRAGTPHREAEEAALERLVSAGFRPDYVAVRREHDLAEPSADAGEVCRVLAAAWLGSARLIDNLRI
jgi:pantoate--beta-alanine ligase